MPPPLIGVFAGIVTAGTWLVTAALRGVGPLGLLLQGFLLLWFGLTMLLESRALVL